MKLKLVFTFIWCFVLKLSAQEGLPVYSDYLTDNWYLVHPAMAGSLFYGGQVRMTGRQQWFDQNLAPSLQTLAASYRFNDKTGGGLIMFNDRNGYYETKGAFATYTHHLYTGKNYNKPCNCLYPDPKNSINELSFGLSIGSVFNSIDQRTFDMTQYDPLISGLKQQKGYIAMDVGVAYVNPTYYAQLSIKNLLFSPHNRYGEFYYPYNRERANYRRVLASAGKFFQMGKFILEPSALFQWAEVSNEKSLDLNTKLYAPIDGDQIWIGFSYRRSFRPVGYYLQNQYNEQLLKAITPLLGINVKDWLFSYNYSYTSGSVLFNDSGFHQISIGYNITHH